MCCGTAEFFNEVRTLNMFFETLSERFGLEASPVMDNPMRGLLERSSLYVACPGFLGRAQTMVMAASLSIPVAWLESHRTACALFTHFLHCCTLSSENETISKNFVNRRF